MKNYILKSVSRSFFMFSFPSSCTLEKHIFILITAIKVSPSLFSLQHSYILFHVSTKIFPQKRGKLHPKACQIFFLSRLHQTRNIFKLFLCCRSLRVYEKREKQNKSLVQFICTQVEKECSRMMLKFCWISTWTLTWIKLKIGHPLINESNQNLVKVDENSGNFFHK